MTGFSKQVRDTILARANGGCELCHFHHPEQIHHRRPRGAGGSKAADTNQAANGLALCAECHRMVESDRVAALANGWLVRQGFDPAEVPVVLRGMWAVLTVEGKVFRPPTGRDRCQQCGFHQPTQGHRSGCQEMSA